MPKRVPYHCCFLDIPKSYYSLLAFVVITTALELSIHLLCFGHLHSLILLSVWRSGWNTREREKTNHWSWFVTHEHNLVKWPQRGELEFICESESRQQQDSQADCWFDHVEPQERSFKATNWQSLQLIVFIIIIWTKNPDNFEICQIQELPTKFGLFYKTLWHHHIPMQFSDPPYYSRVSFFFTCHLMPTTPF